MRAANGLLIPVLVLGLACTSTGKQGHDGTDGGTNSSLHALSLMRQGSLFLQQGRYEEALAQFQQAERAAPGNATAHNMLGLCHLRMANFDLAVNEFNRALALIPAFTDARNNRGTTYLAMQQFRLAEVDFTAVLGDTTYPHHWEAYYNLGLAHLGTRNIAGAEENFRRAITAPTPVFEAHLRLSEIKQEQGDLATAEDLLDDAIIKYPDRPEAALHMGRLLTTLGRYDEARPHLQRLVSSYPDSEVAMEATRLMEH